MDYQTLQWIQKNEERQKEYNRKRYLKNRDVQIKRASEWNEAHKERKKQNSKRAYWKLKEEAFMAYGGYVCQCCGETEPLFLSIDHINNDGYLYRQSKKNSAGTYSKVGRCGETLFRWLKKNNYPEGFQILCLNCNGGKHRNGGICPHQVKKV